jgi:hypothetical protein
MVNGKSKIENPSVDLIGEKEERSAAKFKVKVCLYTF